MVPLEVKINEYKKQLEATVMDFNGIDIFLKHDWLVKYNLEVNWKNGIIKFTRCPGSCMMKHQDVRFKTGRIQTIETTTQNNSKIGKELDKTNLEDLLEYI